MTPRTDAETRFLRELGAQFRAERDRRNWSINEASKAAGLSFTALAHLERGKGTTLSALYRAARAYGFDPFFILERSVTSRVGAGRAGCDVCGRPLLAHRIGECR